VVDDEKGVREGCRKILSVEGYQVTIAEDGQAGWEPSRPRAAASRCCWWT
jgi:CheY-like chemotaxis protein